MVICLWCEHLHYLAYLHAASPRKMQPGKLSAVFICIFQSFHMPVYFSLFTCEKNGITQFIPYFINFYWTHIMYIARGKTAWQGSEMLITLFLWRAKSKLGNYISKSVLTILFFKYIWSTKMFMRHFLIAVKIEIDIKIQLPWCLR